MVHVWSWEHALAPYCIRSTELFYLSSIYLTQTPYWSPIRPISVLRLLLGSNGPSNQVTHLPPWHWCSQGLASNSWEGTWCKPACYGCLDGTSLGRLVPARLGRQAVAGYRWVWNHLLPPVPFKNFLQTWLSHSWRHTQYAQQYFRRERFKGNQEWGPSCQC